MKQILKRISRFAVVSVLYMIAFFLLQLILPGFTYTGLSSLFTMIIGVAIAQALFWRIFVKFFSRWPFWLYPIWMTFLNGLFVYLIGTFLPRIVIANISTAVWIVAGTTAVNTLISALLSLDEEAWFDQKVIRGMVKRQDGTIRTETPGFLFLEIDGLSEMLLRSAIEKGAMPTVQRWLEQGTHRISGWETEFSSQTGAMQAGILLGRNSNIPAYRWWDRDQKN